MKILITGATGNVGGAVLTKLQHTKHELFAGVRDIEAARARLKLGCQYCVVDFEKEIYPEQPFDAVFLVRPPRLAKVGLFGKLLESLQPDTKIVFLSVQGADKKAYLPHAKIEKVITELSLPHVFLRPTYFMENLTTTLWPELKKNRRIYLPSGDLKLNWIAVSDVAEVAAIALTRDLKDEALELCTTEPLGFGEVVNLINVHCGTTLSYSSPSLLGYLLYSFKQRQALGYTFVMLLLHYLPRFTRQRLPGSAAFERLTGEQPTSLAAFVREHCGRFKQL